MAAYSLAVGAASPRRADPGECKARGEISPEEYQEPRTVLEGGHPATRRPSLRENGCPTTTIAQRKESIEPDVEVVVDDAVPLPARVHDEEDALPRRR